MEQHDIDRIRTTIEDALQLFPHHKNMTGAEHELKIQLMRARMTANRMLRRKNEMDGEL